MSEDSNPNNLSKIEDLSKEELLELLHIYAKNWLAHDGCWFLGIEEKLGMEDAIYFDREAWKRFTIVEARRLIGFLQLGEDSGIAGLKAALGFRLYATLIEDKIEVLDDKTLRYYVTSCRVQSTRRKKGLPDFPCKSVGIHEYTLFAKTIDKRFSTECISCPPEITDEAHHCVWEFKLEK
ncbi:MAG: DUF6125 family protein [Candidatus Kapabacteria bacterium]|jgi:hypothetical protein|nr:DUF6125 family protein [Candidatus Kapabacteria bacterium]